MIGALSWRKTVKFSSMRFLASATGERPNSSLETGQTGQIDWANLTPSVKDFRVGSGWFHRTTADDDLHVFCRRLSSRYFVMLCSSSPRSSWASP